MSQIIECILKISNIILIDENEGHGVAEKPTLFSLLEKNGKIRVNLVKSIANFDNNN